MTNWRKMLNEVLEYHNDTLLTVTISDAELDREFDEGYGGTEGVPFTAWGEKYVYFPICYDGSEWVGSAPRNPCDKSMRHQGGG